LIFEERLADARTRIEKDDDCSEKDAQIKLNGILYRIYKQNPSISPWEKEAEKKAAEDDFLEDDDDESLAECKTCKGKVSKTAPVCPHCGENLPAIHVSCPKCNSTQIEIGRKGFGLGKAAVGAVVLGPGGLLAGLHGRKNMELHCLSCGKKWKPKNLK
jgi:hypothetical protein